MAQSGRTTVDSSLDECIGGLHISTGAIGDSSVSDDISVFLVGV